MSLITCSICGREKEEWLRGMCITCARNNSLNITTPPTPSNEPKSTGRCKYPNCPEPLFDDDDWCRKHPPNIGTGNDLTQCLNCYCMTKTIEGKCGKCSDLKSTGNNIRNQISKIFVKWDLPTRQSAISETAALFASHTHYKDQVIKNVAMVANADVDASWVDPMTGKKLYNQAYVQAVRREVIAEIMEKMPEPYGATSSKVSDYGFEHDVGFNNALSLVKQLLSKIEGVDDARS